MPHSIVTYLTPMLLLVAVGAAQAGIHSLQDCSEGADFIANAARSRDNGMAREAFVARLEDDFLTIRAFPPALRWFVKDDDDARFLLGSVLRVYDHPAEPSRHRELFMADCLDRIAANNGMHRDEAEPAAPAADAVES